MIEVVMPLSWFRSYHEDLNDPTIQGLPDDVFKVFHNLRSLANTQRERGHIPYDVAKIAFALRTTPDHAKSSIEHLLSVGLLEEREGHLLPDEWESQQFISDDVSVRVAKSREKAKQENVTTPEVSNVTGNVTRNVTELRAGNVTELHPSGVTRNVLDQTQIRSYSEQKRERDAHAQGKPPFQSQEIEPADSTDGPQEPTVVPAQWPVRADDLAMAHEAGWKGDLKKLQQVANDFVDHYTTQGNRFTLADWELTFKRWVRREVKLYGTANKAANGASASGNGKSPPADPVPQYEKHVVTVSSKKATQ